MKKAGHGWGLPPSIGCNCTSRYNRDAPWSMGEDATAAGAARSGAGRPGPGRPLSSQRWPVAQTKCSNSHWSTPLPAGRRSQFHRWGLEELAAHLEGVCYTGAAPGSRLVAAASCGSVPGWA